MKLAPHHTHLTVYQITTPCYLAKDYWTSIRGKQTKNKKLVVDVVQGDTSIVAIFMKICYL